jgi:hypothetical protein
MAQLPPAHWTSYPPADWISELLERPPDCPAEVVITDPITISDLATALHVKSYQIVAVLMQHDIYKSAFDSIDFTAAALVCAYYRVTPHKAA